MRNGDFYITTPIFYVNDKPHIGHAYTDVIADCIARLHQLIGYNVWSQTGTDEHGQKVSQSAAREGQTPIEFCNAVSRYFYDLAIKMNCCSSYQQFNGLDCFNLHRETLRVADLVNDKRFGAGSVSEDEVRAADLFCKGRNFIRTTEGRDSTTGEVTESSIADSRHIASVMAFWKKLMDHGWLYKGKYSGWYAVRDEAFYADSELIDGKAPTGAEVVWQEQESYFFRLSKFQRVLLSVYNQHPIITPHSKCTEVLSFLSGIDYQSAAAGDFKEEHLQDLSVSRVSLKWGIPVPDDEEHSIYVWIDALVNYLSAVGYPKQKGLDFWSDAKTMHVIGKDILRFHAVYWPALLIAERVHIDEFDAGCENPEFVSRCIEFMPNNLLVHGWWTNNGEKISKSLGNVIVPSVEVGNIMESFETNLEFATDYFRYILVTTMHIGSDGDYSRDRAYVSIESALCDSVGNLVNRVLSMIRKHIDSSDFFTNVGVLHSEEVEFFLNSCKHFERNDVGNLYDNYPSLVRECRISDIVSIAVEIADNCNIYIEKVAPWALRKSDPDRFTSAMQVLYLNIILVMQLLRFLVPNIVERFFDYIELAHRYRRVPCSGVADASECRVGDDDVSGILRYLLKVYSPSDIACANLYEKKLPIFFPKRPLQPK